MTIGDLKSIIAEMPDDAPVLVPGSDHSYTQIGYTETEATYAGRGHYCEYYDEETLEPGERKITALILR